MCACVYGVWVFMCVYYELFKYIQINLKFTYDQMYIDEHVNCTSGQLIWIISYLTNTILKLAIKPRRPKAMLQLFLELNKCSLILISQLPTEA